MDPLKEYEEYQSRKLTEAEDGPRFCVFCQRYIRAEENTYRGGLCRNCYRIIKRGGIYED